MVDADRRVELARCERCVEEGFLCVDCDAQMREGMHQTAAKTWLSYHVHRDQLGAHLKRTSRKMQDALDALHRVRFDVERAHLGVMAQQISAALSTLENIRTQLRGTGSLN
jgi:hypothetical protein